jgi:hypothetical protein
MSTNGGSDMPLFRGTTGSRIWDEEAVEPAASPRYRDVVIGYGLGHCIGHSALEMATLSR